ncbi:MAG: hypothetical protein HWE09_06295 [Cyclobacteriaceae bacterium]|nr:hypothetical protein [Cyclobacteriaceae bacterium]
MIKFFRHIRQNLLSEGKTGKYLKYAIGEIILVMIGILLALQINNTNELRKQREEEAIILSGIQKDFIETRASILKTLTKEEEVILNCRDLIDAIETKDYTINPDTIAFKINRGAFSWYKVEAVMGTYNALIGSGKTSIIQNQELLNALANFSARYNAGFEDESKADDLFNLMMSASKDFLPPLSERTTRQALGYKKKYSAKDKSLAVDELYKHEPFLAYLIERTRWETIRLIHQKQLLHDLNKVLYQFHFSELIPEKELYHKHTGTYINDQANFKILKIRYNDENLMLELPSGRTDNLVQIDSCNFHVINWNAKFKFNTDGGSDTKVLFQRNDSEPILYKRIDD